MDGDLFGHMLHSINFTPKSKIAHASQIYILPLTMRRPQSFVVCKRCEWEDAYIQYMKYLQRRQKLHTSNIDSINIFSNIARKPRAPVFLDIAFLAINLKAFSVMQLDLRWVKFMSMWLLDDHICRLWKACNICETEWAMDSASLTWTSKNSTSWMDGWSSRPYHMKNDGPQKKNLHHSSGTSFCIVSQGHFLAL